MKKIITLLALVLCLHAKAQTYVAIPDSNFVHYLKTIVPTAFKGDSLDTTNTLITTTTQTISVASYSITSLSGVQYFTSLTYLWCPNNYLTSLPPLPNTLTDLMCFQNPIASLPVLPNSLTFLDCRSNSLTSLPTLPNSLQHLSCGGNLTALPPLPPSLTYLFCGGNISITTLPTLPSSLTYLYCSGNSLTSLPSIPASTQTLICSYNSLTTLPTLPSTLGYLDCEYNNISCFPTFPNTIHNLYLNPNPYNCFPNYIPLMTGSPYATTPLCTAGNSNGCAVAGINKIADASNQVNIYPNPTQNNFVIETNSTDKQTLQVFDVNGKLVLTQTINGKTNIDASSLAEGVYNLSLQNSSGIINKRLVIVR